jgi:hypothetical protein
MGEVQRGSIALSAQFEAEVFAVEPNDPMRGAAEAKLRRHAPEYARITAMPGRGRDDARVPRGAERAAGSAHLP